MDIGKIVTSMLRREPKYENVKATYLGNGRFKLSAEGKGKTIAYDSQLTYSATTKTFGSAAWFKLKAPEITINDPVKKETASILYDKQYDTLIIVIEKNGKTTRVQKYGSEVRSEPPISYGAALKIVSDYKEIFRQQERLLNVKAYQKKASKAKLQQSPS